jgi:peptide-O-fucosyltransferase
MAIQWMELCWTILTFLLLILQAIAKSGPETHYLLYSVNPGEGFNLRRDVYMRAATLVRELRKTEDWVLVLPPWPHLHHWKTNYLQANLKWEKFFDLPSLSEYVPVIEFEDFLTKEGRTIDEVRYDF